MITIKEVSTKGGLKTFVKFPFRLYKGSKYWVPPLISQELENFDQKKNPVFKDAEAWFFLAYSGKDLVGRIAVIINWIEVKKQKVNKVRFGWFDFVDDLNVSKALLQKVYDIGLSKGLEYMEGPMGFSSLDKVGVVTEGFEEISKMATWYNHPYYADHYRANGLEVEKTYIESKFPFSNVNPAVFEKSSEILKKRYKLKVINFKSSRKVMRYADKMFDLFNETYSVLPSYVEITEEQKAYFKKKFISFINPEYIKFIEDENKKLVAFTVVMPKFAKALQKANGHLFPTGFFHLLKAKRQSKELVFYLIGVHPDYQNKGLNAIIFSEYYKLFLKKGVEMCYRTPELEDNLATQKIWKHFNPVINIKRKTYAKKFNIEDRFLDD